jgi:hypothetical protein
MRAEMLLGNQRGDVMSLATPGMGLGWNEDSDRQKEHNEGQAERFCHLVFPRDEI